MKCLNIGLIQFYLCLQNPKFLVSILKNFKIDEEIIQNLARFSYYVKFPFFVIDELCKMDIFYKRACEIRALSGIYFWK